MDNKPAPAPQLGEGLADRFGIGADYSQLSHIALRLMAQTQDEGNRRYGRGNWQKGIPISNLLSHAFAHILALQNGDINTETPWQHIGHALWNLEKCAHFMATRPELIDIESLRKVMLIDDDNVAGKKVP